MKIFRYLHIVEWNQHNFFLIHIHIWLEFWFNNKKIFLWYWLLEIKNEANRLWHQTGFFFKDLLTGRLVKQYNSVYSIHTFSRSKGVNIEMINQVNCQSDTLLRYHTISQKRVLSIRIFHEHEMYKLTIILLINRTISYSLV